MRRAAFLLLGYVTCLLISLGAQDTEPLHVIVRRTKTKDFQQQVQQAGDRGFRVVATFEENGYGVVLAKPDDAVPVEYLVLSTQKTSTLDAEVSMAAAVGFRLTCVLNGMTILMERTKGAVQPTHTYSIVATELRQTMEDELRNRAAKGFRVVGQSRSFGGVIKTLEFMAILERPLAETERVLMSYRMLDAVRVSTREREIQDAAARGYQLRRANNRWNSAALLEKPVSIAEARFEYRVLSTKRSLTMQTEMDAAASHGYHFADLLGENVGGETAVVMEREKGVTSRTHEQRLALWKGFTMMGKRNVDAERDLLAQLASGFRLVGETSFTKMASLTGSESFLILERPVADAR